jgi:predicted lipid carrier protein YhbT
VLSEVAAEGLELPEQLAWLVARAPKEFAERVGRVHMDSAFNRKLSEAGLTYIERRFGAAMVKDALAAAIG